MRDYELLYSLTLAGLLDRPMMARVMGFKSNVVMPQPIEEMSLSWSDQVEKTLCVPRTSWVKVKSHELFIAHEYDVFSANV